MVTIDLITGFLGSGKTTFIRKYAEYLMRKGENIGILENDYGAVNVDMMLLGDLMGDNCELEMVAGGCDYDCHRRRFKTKLISMGMCGYTRVLVEPSGIYDVDEFFDVLCEDPLDRWYRIGNVITIVDACLEEKLSEESEYLLASQIANAGQLVFSRSQKAAPGQMEKTIAHLNRILEKFGCRRKFSEDILTKDWAEFTDEDFQKISRGGYVLENHVKLPVEKDNAFESLYYMNLKLPEEEILSRMQQIMGDETYGKVFRIKGFMNTGDNTWVEINITKDNTEVSPIAIGQEVLIIIGEGLQKERIDTLLGADRISV